MEPIMHINVPPQEYLEEFYNKCHNPPGPGGGQFCGGNFSGSDVQWSSHSERGSARFADLSAGKTYKALPNAKLDSDLAGAEEWPEKWIDDKARKSDKFAVPTFRKGEKGLQDPVSYDEAVRAHNLAEITRTRNGKKEYLAPDTNHLTARLKVIGLDKVISPKELLRMVQKDKPVWVDEASVNNWRFYKVPKSPFEIGVALSNDGTIGTVIPGGYLAMALDYAGEQKGNRTSSSQLGRLLYRQQALRQFPSDEIATPTVPIEPIKIGNTTFRYGRRSR